MNDKLRFLGIDVGAETVKVVELVGTRGVLEVGQRRLVEHHKDPAGALVKLLTELDWDSVAGAATTGRASRTLNMERVPTKAALARGVETNFPQHIPGTVVSIGSHGFSVLELRGGEQQIYRENSRCSQGTGNFLCQLVERFELSVQEASELCADVEEPAALSGRCPVILKTDMTHLANKGEDRAAIVAGLYDAVCENVQVLIKPRISPRKILLVGGVMRAARVHENFRRFAAARDMEVVSAPVDDCLFLEALGAAVVASETDTAHPPLDALFHNDHATDFERVPALRGSLSLVKRMPAQSFANGGASRRVVLGFDIGSTGSKTLALDADDMRPVWEGYLNTLGDPVEAARRLAAKFLEETGGLHEVVAIGATGSGREIVGSLMSSCFGPEPVFVLNEIAAHAEGALYFDPEVDTIFEIGGQDAKYIRLDGGRICDAAMNEACSAGTGSFIAEQGSKFETVNDVVQMGRVAVDAEEGVSLGQHCSVFMAEVIDEAVAAGVAQPNILAGIYDSIIQNYLNRVKGNRSVGQRIFCQGMPFMSDALAAAVARQTGRQVVIPPNPGTIGALGIALLTARELSCDGAALDLQPFLGARVTRKDTFVCKSKRGCGGAGNKCKIDRIRTVVADKKQKFMWGGNCSLFDAGTNKRKLPDLAPDPFRERQELSRSVIASATELRGRPLVSMSDEFSLKGMLPFFTNFVSELGFDVKVHTEAGQRDLKRGIESANVPFCAPMQMYQGVMDEILSEEPAYALAPRVRDLPRQRDERHAVTCPIVQASPDIVRRGAGDTKTQILTPRVDMGPGNLDSDRFRTSVRALAITLDAENLWERAYAAGCRAQRTFDAGLLEIGRRALAFAKERDVVPVVVLGRAYTIYNTVLNSNVPNLLREQGAIAIPVDCYPIGAETPVFEDLYWGNGQINIRAAHQIRRTDGVYSLFCSNYSCGPDSFNLHFFSHVMENKPFAIIETDGHSGDAGTKTRIEAFLHCVHGDRQLAADAREALPRTNFEAVNGGNISLGDARRDKELVLLPRMGPGVEVLAQLFQAEGVRAEALPMPSRDSLRTGRRYTSGKECLPLTVTLGSMLDRLERERDTGDKFAFFMPNANGPCRFGVYNLLHKILLEKTGWGERVRILSPADNDYFADVSADFQVRACVMLLAADLLLAAVHDVRPAERTEGAAQAIYDRYFEELCVLARNQPSVPLFRALSELVGGVFGVRDLLSRAAGEFRAVKDFSRDLPTVSVVGEIYVRLDPFANDFVVEKLERRGLRTTVAPFSEWLEYMAHLKLQRLDEGRGLPGDRRMNALISQTLQNRATTRLYNVMATRLGWGPRVTVDDALSAAAPYLSRELMGEAVLTLGGPVHEHNHGAIDGVVAVGPHECMPNKVAEAQFAHVSQDSGLLSLALPLNGDPVDAEVLDRFAFEVRQRHASGRKQTPRAEPHTGASPFDAARRSAFVAALRKIPTLPGFGGGDESGPSGPFVPLGGLMNGLRKRRGRRSPPPS